VTTIFLIRHGQTSAVGHRLTGRMRGVPLDDEGVRQAHRLVRRLAGVDLAAVYSSPMERTRQTAAPLAARLGLEVAVRDGLNEIDFGAWTGRSWDELAHLPGWRQFNAVRSCTRVPGGEHICEVQARVIGALERVANDHPDQSVAVVTHADVIRAALAYFSGVAIDLFLRLDISPASVSTVVLTADGPRIACINYAESLPH
jgi:probable phosphomutase (TIGR03848 family)